MKTKNETLLRRNTNRRPSLLEDIKPFTHLDGINGLPEKLPYIKSPSTPTKQFFFPNTQKRFTRENSKEDLYNLPVDKNQKTQNIMPLINKHSNAVTRVAFKSRVGSVLSKPKLNNQDAFIIKPALLGNRGQYLFAVCDGHGTYGHYVSNYIKGAFPSIIEETFSNDSSLANIEKNLHRSVVKLCKGLQETGIEIAFSGSTLISLLIFDNLCICGNVGDSRAVLGRLSAGT